MLCYVLGHAIKDILTAIVFKFLCLELVASLTANISSERSNAKCYSQLWASKLSSYYWMFYLSVLSL